MNGSTSLIPLTSFTADIFSMVSGIGQGYYSKQWSGFLFLLLYGVALMILIILRFLRPGGYIELVEFHVIPSSYDDSLPADSQIMEFYNVLAEIGSKVGLDLAVAEKYPQMMVDAGFEEVETKIFDLPLGDWMEGRRMKEVGRFQRYQMTTGLHGIAYGLLTRLGGWGPEKVEVFLAGVRREMNDRNVHSLYKV